MTPRAHHTAPGGTHVALPHMTLALLIGVPLALIVAYAFWDGGRIGTWARLALAIEAESPRRRRPRARVGQRASRAGRSVGERLER